MWIVKNCELKFDPVNILPKSPFDILFPSVPGLIV